jgi:hypothetical protein
VTFAWNFFDVEVVGTDKDDTLEFESAADPAWTSIDDIYVFEKYLS